MKDEFEFWDGDGFRLFFDRDFLDKKINTIIKNDKNEKDLLKFYFSKYIQKKGIQPLDINQLSMKDIANHFKK